MTDILSSILESAVGVEKNSSQWMEDFIYNTFTFKNLQQLEVGEERLLLVVNCCDSKLWKHVGNARR